MFVCSNCGAHYSGEFLQCPQCGSTKRITEAEDKTNNSPIGFLITLAVILALLGIIGYGVYFLYNPVKDDKITSDIENIDITTTTNESQTKTTTTTAAKSTTTTTKLVGTDTPLGSKYSYTRPEGYSVLPISDADKQKYGFSDGVECITNGLEEYCAGLQEGKNIQLNSSNKDQVNSALHSMGFSDLISTRLYNNTYYYYYVTYDSKITGALMKNKGSNILMVSFAITGSEVNEETMKTAVAIMNTIK